MPRSISGKFFDSPDKSDLSADQQRGLSVGFSIEDVKSNWYTLNHAWVISKGVSCDEARHLSAIQIQGIDIGLSLDEVKQLTDSQVRGMAQGLTKEQVSNDWFSDSHADAIDAGLTYDNIKGLPQDQAAKMTTDYMVEMQQIEDDALESERRYRND